MNTEMNTDKELKSQQELSDTTDNKDLHYKIIDKTPFGVAKTPKGYMVVLGYQAVSEPFETMEEAEEDAQKINWVKIISVLNKLKETWEQ